ncbi:MAG TPA: hypothetical protein VEU96_04700 [Bryobacteraceae bacterium]|nr:hypothetical protein [Bryobacteraceae bacterium]
MDVEYLIEKCSGLFQKTHVRHALPALPENVEFCILAEAGIIEAQTLLLCHSIRQFTGVYSSAAIVAVSPRPGHRPSRATVKELEALGAAYLELDLHSLCPSYGPSFGIYVAAHVARRPGPPVLVLLDSDTLFLGEPDFSLAGVDIALRPVDVKGMCTTGPGDPFDEYWRQLCTLCGVDYRDLPQVMTTVDRQTVLANYNAGLVAVRRDSGIFEKAEEFFTRILAADARPFGGSGMRVTSGTGVVDLDGSEFWGSRQAALSLAITSMKSPVQTLPPAYNVPLHLFESLERPTAAPIHLHYHWLCSGDGCSANPMLDGRMELPDSVVTWLRRHLPL